MQVTHIANPLQVRARQIQGIAHHKTTDIDGTQIVEISVPGDKVMFLSSDMVTRYRPRVGDYLIMREDVGSYILPQEVFEHSFRVIGTEMAGDHPAKAVFRSRANEDDLRARAMDYASRHSTDGPEFVVRAAEAYYDYLKGAA